MRTPVQTGRRFKRPTTAEAPRAVPSASTSHISSGGGCHSASRPGHPFSQVSGQTCTVQRYCRAHVSYVPVKFTRNAFSSRDLTSSEDSSCMRSRGGMRPRPPGVFFECTCTFKVQPAGVHLKKVGNCVVAIAQARKTKPLSVALMPCGAPAAAAVLLRLPTRVEQTNFKLKL